MPRSILEKFSLANKTVIITGATGGIGAEITVALAEAGANIVSLELPNDPLSAALRHAIKPTGRQLTPFECNIRDDQSIKAAFAAIWKSGIVPNILVNGAGVTRHTTVEDTPVADLDTVSYTYDRLAVCFTRGERSLKITPGHGNQLSRYLFGDAGVRSGTPSPEAAGKDHQLWIHGSSPCPD